MFGLPDEFWAAIAGALTGGAITFGLQVHQFNQRDKETEKQKIERDRDLAKHIVVKVLTIASDIKAIHEYVSIGNDKHPDIQMWTGVTPMVGVPSGIRIHENEMLLLPNDLPDRLFSNLYALARKHQTYVDLITIYNERRRRLGDMLAEAHSIDDEGAFVITAEQFRRFEPQMLELNSILAHIVDDGPGDVEAAFVHLRRLIDFMNLKYDLELAVSERDDSVGG